MSVLSYREVQCVPIPTLNRHLKPIHIVLHIHICLDSSHIWTKSHFSNNLKRIFGKVTSVNNVKF